jgi:hypothetical protein
MQGLTQGVRRGNFTPQTDIISSTSRYPHKSVITHFPYKEHELANFPSKKKINSRHDMQTFCPKQCYVGLLCGI